MNPEQSPKHNSSLDWKLVENTPFAGDSTPSSPSLPTTSPNRRCNLLLRFIEKDGHMDDIQKFLEQTSSREYNDNFPEDYTAAVDSSLNPTEKAALKYYSGYNYNLINQVARGQWDYDSLGTKTPEKLAQAESTIEQIDQAIHASPAPDIDFTTYRGTNLDSFLGYNINSIDDLANLEGQFFLETGFCSTSLSPKTSFFDRDFDNPLRKPCNIQIKYSIPKEYNNGIGLFTKDLSYNPEQEEFLIGRHSLSYITDVSISPDHAHATIETTLIPDKVYN